MKNKFSILFVILFIFFGSGAQAAKKDNNLSPEEKLNLVTVTMQRTLETMDKNIAEAAKELSTTGLDGQAARQILKELCSMHPNSDACSTTDANGTLVAIYPPKYKEYEGLSVEYQDHIKLLQRTKSPVLSPLFIDVDGEYMIGMAWPVLSKTGNFLGSVDIVGMPKIYFDNVIKPLLSWNTNTLWVMETSGRIVYCSDHPAIGDNYLKNKFYNMPNGIQSLVKDIVAKKSGADRFEMAPSGAKRPPSRKCIWDTVKLHDTEFRVILFTEIR